MQPSGEFYLVCHFKTMSSQASSHVCFLFKKEVGGERKGGGQRGGGEGGAGGGGRRTGFLILLR